MTVPIGQVIFSAVKPIFKIYLIIGMGFLLAKKNILSVPTSRDISDIVVSAIMPCLIFNKIVTNLKSSDIKNLGIIFFTGTLLFIVGGTLAYVISIVTRSPKRWLGGLISVGLFPNISDLPIAYMQTLSQAGDIFTTAEGNKGVAYVCIFLASQIFYQFSLGLYQLIEWDFRHELQPSNDEEKTVDTCQGRNSTDGTGAIDQDKENNNTNHKNKNKNDDDDDDDGSSESSDNSPGAESRILTKTYSCTSSRTSLRSSLSESVRSECDQPQEVTTEGTHAERASATGASRTRRASFSSLGPSQTNQHDVQPSIYNLRLTSSRASDMRRMRSEDIHDVINEYSEFQELKKTASIAQEANSDGMSVVTKKPLWKKFLNNLKNFLAPNSISLIVSLAIAMSPPLKALFVHTSNFHIHDAPDGDPPLSFLIDFTGYVGAASVPLGLILLGATIARLQVKKMPQGFWKTALAVTVLRLVIIPIIGVGITTGFQKGGWYGDDKLVRFISVLEYGLPSATALVYFTAFYTDPNSDDHLQMDCLAVCLIFQYLLLFISLPFLVTFSIKVSLGM